MKLKFPIYQSLNISYEIFWNKDDECIVVAQLVFTILIMQDGWLKGWMDGLAVIWVKGILKIEYFMPNHFKEDAKRPQKND